MVYVIVKLKFIKFIDFIKKQVKKMMKCFKIRVICIDLNFK